jgi:hypothetical protein
VKAAGNAFTSSAMVASTLVLPSTLQPSLAPSDRTALRCRDVNIQLMTAAHDGNIHADLRPALAKP